MGGQADQRLLLKQEYVTGVLSDWKGSYGFITPDVEVIHPLARAGGKIYVAQADFAQEFQPCVGCFVRFRLYGNDRGLGALGVMPADHEHAATDAKAACPTPMLRPTKRRRTDEGNQHEEEMVHPVKPHPMSMVPSKPKGNAGPALQAGERTVVAEAITGTVTEWRGQTFWITPDSPVEGVDLSVGGRRADAILALARNVEGEAPEVDAAVIFCVCKDVVGYSATAVMVIEQGGGSGAPHIVTDEVEVLSDCDVEVCEVIKRPKRGALAGAAGGGAAVRKSWPHGAAVLIPPRTRMGTIQPNSGGKGGGKAAQSRVRVSEEPMYGEVSQVKGSVVWIAPVDPIDDGKHGGKLFAHLSDIANAGGYPLAQGDAVEFRLYRDARGLGAEAVVKL